MRRYWTPWKVLQRLPCAADSPVTAPVGRGPGVVGEPVGRPFAEQPQLAPQVRVSDPSETPALREGMTPH